MSSENIVAAKGKLERAISQLTAPRLAVYHDANVYVDCLYVQLAEALPGARGDSQLPARSLPPLWVDAAMLKTEIDTSAAKWARRKGSTVERLLMVRDRGWRPQDTQVVRGMAREVEGWCDQIVALLDPRSVKEISAPCPSCGRATVLKRDSAGEMVRKAALQVVAGEGCVCLGCDAHWGPELYLHLARVLGFELPEGVLE